MAVVGTPSMSSRARAARGRDHRAPPGRGARGAVVESALAPGPQRAEDLRPAAAGARGRAPRGRAPARQAPRRRRRRRPRAARATSCPPGACSSSTSAPRCATARSRLLVRLADGRELRLREFGTKQARVGQGPARRRRRARRRARRRSARRPGPTRRRCASCSPRRARGRCTRVLRDQRVIAGSGARGSTRSCGRRGCRPSSAATTSTTTRPTRLRDAMRRAPRRRASSTTRRSCSCRSPTSCRCRSRSIATRASPARAAARRSRRSTTRTTSCATARGPDRRARPQGPPAVAAAEVGGGQMPGSPLPASRTMQRKPMCAVEVSIASP